MLARCCRATLALALTLAAGMSCCFVAGTAAQSVKKMTLVQMHPIMGIGEEIFLYAVPKRLGYFTAEGLDVEIQNSQTAMISAQVLQSSNAQVGTTAAAAIMTVREQNGDLVSFFNLKRNAGIKPTTVFTDLRIGRLFDLTERFRLEGTVDMFNLINKFNVADVNVLWSNAGQPTATFDPRQFQFGLKLTF